MDRHPNKLILEYIISPYTIRNIDLLMMASRKFMKLGLVWFCSIAQLRLESKGWRILDIAIITAKKHAVHVDKLRADIDQAALLLNEVRRMQIVQRVNDVDCDICLLTCARMPNGGACYAD